MRLLLDTHLYLWVANQPGRLPARARRLMLDASEVYVSAASIWELAIKIGLGKLEGDPEKLARAVAESQFHDLAITTQHAAAVRALPLHHKDPFDRLLVAQANAERLQLLTVDELLGLYSDQVIVV